jgi:hypothetical protein
MDSIKTVLERWKAESPPFFLKLKKVALKVGGSAAAVVTANAIMGLNLNTTLISVLSYAVAACAAIAGTAQLSQKND